MKKINFNRYSFLSTFVAVPWIVVLLFNFYEVETLNSFFEMNEVIIKIAFLLVSTIGCIIIFWKLLKDKIITKMKKNIFLLLDIIIFCLTFFSIWFILALRNGIGF